MENLLITYRSLNGRKENLRRWIDKGMMGLGAHSSYAAYKIGVDELTFLNWRNGLHFPRLENFERLYTFLTNNGERSWEWKSVEQDQEEENDFTTLALQLITTPFYQRRVRNTETLAKILIEVSQQIQL